MKLPEKLMIYHKLISYAISFAFEQALITIRKLLNIHEQIEEGQIYFPTVRCLSHFYNG